MDRKDSDAVIANAPEERRAFLRKAVTIGIGAPAVATFSMSGLMSRPKAAQASNFS
jgi:hypothetical protein